MDIQSIMTPNPKACPRNASLEQIAQMMRDEDIGEVPVVDSDGGNRKLLGVITDRDIVVRAVAEGENPSRITESMQTRIRDSYSSFEHGSGIGTTRTGSPAADACASSTSRLTACMATRCTASLMVVSSPATAPGCRCRSTWISACRNDGVSWQGTTLRAWIAWRRQSPPCAHGIIAGAASRWRRRSRCTGARR